MTIVQFIKKSNSTCVMKNYLLPSCRLVVVEMLHYIIPRYTINHSKWSVPSSRYRYICDRICKKGPLRSKVNMLVRTQNAQTRHYMQSRIIASSEPIVYSLPSNQVKTIVLSCVSNQDQILSPSPSCCSCTDKTRNVTRTIYRNVYGEIGDAPTLSHCAMIDHTLGRCCGLGLPTTSASS